MKKLLLILLASIFIPSISRAQLIDFTWNEKGSTQSGYTPGVTIRVGESYQLKYSTSPQTNTPFNDLWNWNFYIYNPTSALWVVEDSPSLFSISKEGIITGKSEGVAALRGTGLIQGEARRDRFYIEVVSNAGITPVLADKTSVKYYNLQGIPVDPDKAKGQMLIETDGCTAKKFFNR